MTKVVKKWGHALFKRRNANVSLEREVKECEAKMEEIQRKLQSRDKEVRYHHSVSILLVRWRR